MYHGQVEKFVKDWQPFCRLLEPDEQANWDGLADAALERPYPGHAQNETNAKWLIVLSMFVEQQQEIAKLRGKFENQATSTNSLRQRS